MAKSTLVPRFAVAMLGGRLHWAVPRILQSSGNLETLYTDFCATKGAFGILALLPEFLRSTRIRQLLARFPPDIPRERIVSFNNFGVRYALKRSRNRKASGMTKTFLWANRKFCQLVSRKDWGKASAVFTYNSAGLEILQQAKERGLLTVMEQTIAPFLVEQRLLAQERELHPGWECFQDEGGVNEYSEREQKEWKLADLILCGSDFVRNGICECGGPAGKSYVVPYGIQTSTKVRGGRTFDRNHRKLRVLTVGTVGLRKGAPYVLQTARRLKSIAEFRIVGPMQILPEAQQQLRASVELTGGIPATDMPAHYQWADLFLLPSICEGSATAVYEALSWGLPVICTPNTGSVVRHMKDGFVVPIRDVDAIVMAVEALANDANLLRNCRENAFDRAGEFGLSNYADRLVEALGNLPTDGCVFNVQ